MVAEQISGAEAAVPTDETADISRSDLSQSLCQTRGVLKKELTAQCVQAAERHAKGGKAKNGQGTSATDPPSRGSRSPSHWKEISTGASDTHIVRSSNATAATSRQVQEERDCGAALAKHIRKLPEQLRRSLT